MTSPSAVDMAVHNVRTVRELVAQFGASLAAAAQAPGGVTLSPDLCAASARALESWTTVLDSTLDLLVPPPAAAPAPPPRLPKPRLATLDGEVLP